MSSFPPLRKLHYVLAVARELHFRKAAERLNLSQPSLSRQIRELEEEIGFEIFHRNHHFVAPLRPEGLHRRRRTNAFAGCRLTFRRAKDHARKISRRNSAWFIIGHSPFVATGLQAANSLGSKTEIRLSESPVPHSICARADGSIGSGAYPGGSDIRVLVEGCGVQQIPIGSDRLCVVTMQKFSSFVEAPR